MRSSSYSAMMLAVFVSVSVCKATGIEIREVEKEGWQTIEMENDYYKVVLIPQIARLPYSYYFKLTGHEHFAHNVDLSTPKPGNEFVYYGGLIDSIPWVSGNVNGEKLSAKGYLHFSPWDFRTGQTEHTVWFEGGTRFTYEDPVTGEPVTIMFQKKITGYDDSPELKMDYLIRNVGETDATFTFAAHARTGIAKLDRGDYFHAPGKRCYVSAIHTVDELVAEKIRPFTWTEWPIREATDFVPQKERPQRIFAYVPATWCVVGDAKHDETLFFVAGPVRYARTTDIMKMGIFMTHAGYVVEPCLSYAVRADREVWERPGSTVQLEKGRDCGFSLSLVAYRRLSRTMVDRIHKVYPECILLDEPTVAISSTNMRLEGRIAAAGSGTLIVKMGSRPVSERQVDAGTFDLKELCEVPYEKNREVSLLFRNSKGEKTMVVFNRQKFDFALPEFAYRRRIVIDAAQVFYNDHREFPVLVSVEAEGLKSVGHGGHVASEEGRDICFTDETGKLLAHETETYDPVSGNLKAWVRIPRLSCTDGNTFYVYYGNPEGVVPEKKAPVWDRHYRLVRHFNEMFFDGEKDYVTIPYDTKWNVGNQVTAEAWVKSPNSRAEVMQALVSRWSPLTTFDTFDAYDAGTTSGLDTSGFLGAVFDGRYVYFSPQHDKTRRHGKALRYDTHGDFHDGKSWLGYDASNTSGLDARGYYGAVYDGRYIYYVPRYDGRNLHSRALRYDTRKPFDDCGSWLAYDVGLDSSYQSAAFDGRYIYFSPGARKSTLVLRYDILGAFMDKSSWTTFDAAGIGGLMIGDFDGAAFDGRYIYFAPLGHGIPLRYDTTREFIDKSGWEAFDATALGMHLCVGSVFDGRYVYFCSYNKHGLVRFDTRGDFKDAKSWSKYDAKLTAGVRWAGYDGGFFDGRYVYFIPFVDHETGIEGRKTKFHCQVVRHDTQSEKDFTDPESWEMAEAADTAGLKTVGYNGGAFDGRYFYFAPWHDGAEYEAKGKIVGHGRVLRYDSLGNNGSFSLRYCDYGHNGGLNAAVPGPRFIVNTKKGVVSCAADRNLEPGWHHLAGVYDGKAIRLYVDGVLVDEREGRGPIVRNTLDISVGRILHGSAHFEGIIDRVMISNRTRNPGWIATMHANLRSPGTFCRMKEEELRQQARF